MGNNFSNHLLIAMPSLRDLNFSHSVTYLCEHNDGGAFGLVINRPTDISLGEVFSDQLAQANQTPVYIGGPIQQNRGFVLHQPLGNWQATLAVTDVIGLTASSDILNAIAHCDGPASSLVTIGYAGWGPGQLEQEIGENSWLTCPAEPELVFETAPENVWAASASLLGVDLNLISSCPGHA
ncbi:MAG: YqgE/AlgH family protein [Gammaproteobacteria bacterium]